MNIYSSLFLILSQTYEKGNISRTMDSLKIGDTMRFKGPKGNFIYTPRLCEHINMIAGGTGITPMLQIIRAVLGNPADPTDINLIYANVNYDDILLREDLEQLSKLHSNRFKVYFVLNNPPPSWDGGVGFVTKDHIKEHLRNPDDGNGKLLICGPPPMVAAMKKNIQELGYPAPNTISKLQDKVNLAYYISMTFTDHLPRSLFSKLLGIYVVKVLFVIYIDICKIIVIRYLLQVARFPSIDIDQLLSGFTRGGIRGSIRPAHFKAGKTRDS